MLKSRNLWHYGYILGFALVIMGLISPWWCSGHWTFRCTIGIGFSWYSVPGLYLFEEFMFIPSVGAIMVIPFAILLWLEFQSPLQRKKWRTLLVFITFFVCIFAVLNTLLLVKNANHCESFNAWTTNYIESLFPSKSPCSFQMPWITDVARGIWMTLLGSFLLLCARIFDHNIAIKTG